MKKTFLFTSIIIFLLTICFPVMAWVLVDTSSSVEVIPIQILRVTHADIGGSPMDDFEKILWAASLTAFFGLLAQAFAQIIIKFLIEPLYEQKKLIGEIADNLIFYADIYCNPDSTAKTPRTPGKIVQARRKTVPGIEL